MPRHLQKGRRLSGDCAILLEFRPTDTLVKLLSKVGINLNENAQGSTVLLT